MTIVIHEWGSDQTCKRCCIPKDLAHKPQLCPGKPPSARQAARMRWPLGGADAQALEGALTLTEKERDALQAKLDAELPAMWREDLASLNECLDRVGRERDEAQAEIKRLRSALQSIADGFDLVVGSVDDPSAKQLDGYYRGYAAAALARVTLEGSR